MNGLKDEEFETTDVYQWLLGHSYEYGYILRYPHDKVALTQNDSCNIFRYVGKENALKMLNQNICLEELTNSYWHFKQNKYTERELNRYR